MQSDADIDLSCVTSICKCGPMPTVLRRWVGPGKLVSSAHSPQLHNVTYHRKLFRLHSDCTHCCTNNCTSQPNSYNCGHTRRCWLHTH